MKLQGLPEPLKLKTEEQLLEVLNSNTPRTVFNLCEIYLCLYKELQWDNIHPAMRAKLRTMRELAAEALQQPELGDVFMLQSRAANMLNDGRKK